MFAKMKEIADANGWVAYHLSTAMCQQHRLNVLKELQKKLEILQEALKKNGACTESYLHFYSDGRGWS